MSDLESEINLLSGESSSDEDLDLFLQGEPRQNNRNYLDEIIPAYTDEVLFEHFRVSRKVAGLLSDKYTDSSVYKNQDGQFGHICAYDQVVIFLWYLGHQTAGYRDVADRFDIAVSSLHRIIVRVTVFLSNLSPSIIEWPTGNKMKSSEQSFRENGFPNIIGAIDGCHIKIDKPQIDPDSYINRKGYYSIQMQVVCDEHRKIIDLFVGYPGSVHDSRVLRSSSLFRTLEEKCGSYYILGDSDYPLLKNLLTPYRDRGQLTRKQQNYNAKLCKNRYVIEHCFGILKQKFRQLYHIKLRNIKLIVNLIRAACVLHNIAIEDEFEYTEENIGAHLPNAPDVDVQQEQLEDDPHAKVIRDNIANRLN